ncbi:MAG: hypothetical protein ACKVOE_10175 [Rickettsiales bacterium]
MDNTKPSVGKRFKDAAFGATLGGTVMTGAWLVENAVGKASKTGNILPAKGQWKITAVAAALMAAYGFATAKKEESLTTAPRETTTTSPDTVEPAKFTETTKFRSMVTQSQNPIRMVR